MEFPKFPLEGMCVSEKGYDWKNAVESIVEQMTELEKDFLWECDTTTKIISIESLYFTLPKSIQLQFTTLIQNIFTNNESVIFDLSFVMDKYWSANSELILMKKEEQTLVVDEAFLMLNENFTVLFVQSSDVCSKQK